MSYIQKHQRIPDRPIRDSGLPGKVRALGVLTATFILLGSCGGGGGSSGTTDYQPSIAAGNWLIIDLSTGATTAVLSDPGVGTTTKLVVKRLDSTSFLGVTEVSKGQWTTIMGTAPWADITTQILADGASEDPGRPANNISYMDAQAFIAAVSSRTHLSVSLPTPAQYEEAVGAGPWPWGSATDAATVGQYASVTDTSTTVGHLVAVGTSTPVNGLYDIIGNVREWTTAGTAFGGSSFDTLDSIKATPLVNTVGTTTEHPLYGLRLACAVQ